VWAFVGQLNQFDLTVEDTAEIGIRLANGVIGSIYLDFNRRPFSHKLEIIGTEGTICWNALQGDLQVYRAAGESWEVFPNRIGFERNELFLSEMCHFIDVIEGKTAQFVAWQMGENIASSAGGKKLSNGWKVCLL